MTKQLALNKTHLTVYSIYRSLKIAHMQYLLVLLAECLLCLSMVTAGEWVVETHSLNVRAPAAIAGVEDAAIGDVSDLCLLLHAFINQ